MHKHLAVFTLFVLAMLFTACGDDVAQGIDDTVDAGMDSGMDAGSEPLDPDDFAKCEGNWVQNSACDTSDGEPGFCNSQGCCLPCVEYPVSEYPQTATACEDACVSDDDCGDGFCGFDHRCRSNVDDGDNTDDPDMGTTEDTGSDDQPDTGTDDDAGNGTSDTGDEDCTSNDDCPDDELCLVDGSCYDPMTSDTFTFCNTDADCVDGETCSSQGLCLLEDEEPDVVFPDMLDACPDQHTCADEETCTSQGYCVPDVFIDLCSSNADCGDDETCNTQGLCLIESDGDGGGGNSNGNDIDIHPHDQSTLDECPDDHTCGAQETCSSQGICLPGFQTCPDQHTCAPDEVCTSQGFCFPDNNSGDGDVDAGMSDAGTDSGSGDLDMGTVDASSDVGTTDTGTDTGQSTDVTVDSGDSGTNDTSTTDSGSDSDADTGADVGFNQSLCNNNDDGDLESGEMLCMVDGDGDGTDESLCFVVDLFEGLLIHQQTDACAVGTGSNFSWDYLNGYQDNDCDAVSPVDGYFCIDFTGRSHGAVEVTLVSHENSDTEWWQNRYVCDPDDLDTQAEEDFAEAWCAGDISTDSYRIAVEWRSDGLHPNGNLQIP